MSRIPRVRFPHLAYVTAALLFASCMQGTESGTETGMQGIEGRLKRDGKEASSGAQVYAFRRAGAPASRSADSALILGVLQNRDTLADTALFRAAKTDADGRFRITGLPAGEYGVLGIDSDKVEHANWVGFAASVAVRNAGITPVGTLELSLAGGIRAVVAAHHKPLRHAECGIPGISFVAYTDDGGNCLLYNMPPGDYSISFEAAGYLPAQRGPLSVKRGEILSLPDTIELSRDPAGAPPAPTGFSAAYDPVTRVVTLSWDPAEVPDVAGYVLSRKPKEALNTVVDKILNDQLIPGTAYRDTLWRSLPDTAAAAFIYRLVARDSQGNEGTGAVSNEVEVSPAARPAGLGFVQARYEARENAGSIAAWVRRTGPVDRPVTVKWSLSDSTAKRDSDYVATGGELSFKAGDTLLPLYSLLVDDRVVEGPEAFLATLSSPGNGAVLGASRAVFAIADDDSLTRIACPRTAFAAQEGDSLSIEIRRSGDLARRAAFRYAFIGAPDSGATATPDKDFASASGALAFDSGATVLRLPLRILDDTLQERAERMLVRFSDPSRDVDLSACPDLEVGIADDDTQYVAVPVDFTKAYTSHTAVRPDVSRFPGGLYDGDSDKVGLAEHRTSNPDLLPKPIAYYDFRDCGAATLPDRSGNGHDARVGGALECRIDGTGTWAQFDTRDTVTIDDRSDLSFQEGLTVAAWVKPDSLVHRRTLIGKTYAPTAFSLEIVDGEYDFYIAIEDGTDQGYTCTLTAPATAGVWTHVAGTFDGKVMRLYVDGELKNELQVSGRIKITDRPITLGNWPEWSAYAGGMREAKLFGRALNAWQIQEQRTLGDFPTKPLSVTFDFAQPIWTMGAGAVLSSALGTTRYAWTLAGADNAADLDAKTGSYQVLNGSITAAPDIWSRSSYKARKLKAFRFTVTGMAGTGFVQINELNLVGAERAPLP